MTEDEIDFDALDVGLLEQLARQENEPFIATSALAKLSSRDQASARAVIDEILERADVIVRCPQGHTTFRARRTPGAR